MRAFLRQMRIEFVKRNPDENEIRVPNFDDLEVKERGVLMRAMREALRESDKPHETTR